MEITKTVVFGREKALLLGDYNTYRSQLSRQLHAVRKRLGRTTKKNSKFTQSPPVTAEDIAKNHEFVHLLLYTSERAWAHAMLMRSAHSSDQKGIHGSTRSHIASRLAKAQIYANQLFELLADRSTTGADERDVLEARAYAAYIAGAEKFEKQSWEPCVVKYSEAWVIYNALSLSSQNDAFKDLLSGTIEPSIRYGAYQMGIPRTVGEPAIARKYFPKDDPELTTAIQKLDSSVSADNEEAKIVSAGLELAPNQITWRSRTVDIEDAGIAMALGSVAGASKVLSEKLSADSSAHPKDKAAAYDDILIHSQDAVDATNKAIQELLAEGIGQSDKRMQSLQITKTAVSYDLISWRIGRNRVLSGENDGVSMESAPMAQGKSKKKKEAAEKNEGTGRKLFRLREKVVLYDASLQSLEMLKELPGVASDSAFLTELEARKGYFRALKCLAIARSHTLLGHHKNALALLNRAYELSNQALPPLSSSDSSAALPPSIAITPAQSQSLTNLLQGQLQQQRAFLDLTQTPGSLASVNAAHSLPLIENLNEYPAQVDLNNIVTYPPKLQPVPVKPLFFDVAYNYIEYPGRASKVAPAEAAQSQPAKAQAEAPAPQKKGWFGFGR